MQLTIHDVGHGQCISLIDGNQAMLWDCGHKDNERPSSFLPQAKITHIHTLFVTNYDEDHISDLPDLRHKLKIEQIGRNSSMDAGQLEALKLLSGSLSPAMEELLDMMRGYNGAPTATEVAFPGVSFRLFNNAYLRDFVDTNNLSLVTFLKAGDLCMLIPGDLERPGWQMLLKNPDFVAELACVSIFVAPHHGRESGYCEDVFEYCHPAVIVFSDSEIVHATQEMANQYANHASGVQFRGKTRRVLSTRKDGPIAWTR